MPRCSPPKLLLRVISITLAPWVGHGKIAPVIVRFRSFAATSGDQMSLDARAQEPRAGGYASMIELVLPQMVRKLTATKTRT